MIADVFVSLQLFVDNLFFSVYKFLKMLIFFFYSCDFII